MYECKKVTKQRNKGGIESDPSLLHSPWYIYTSSIIVQRQQIQVGCVGGVMMIVFLCFQLEFFSFFCFIQNVVDAEKETLG